MHIRGSLRLTLVLLVGLALALVFRPASAAGNRLAWCPSWQAVSSATISDPQGDSPETLTPQQLTSLESWRATTTTWHKVGSYGDWNMPADAQETYRIVLETVTGTHYAFLMLSPTDTANVWVFGYTDLAITTDAQGNHAGIHDYCRSGNGGHFVISVTEFNHLMGGN